MAGIWDEAVEAGLRLRGAAKPVAQGLEALSTPLAGRVAKSVETAPQKAVEAATIPDALKNIKGPQQAVPTEIDVPVFEGIKPLEDVRAAQTRLVSRGLSEVAPFGDGQKEVPEEVSNTLKTHFKEVMGTDADEHDVSMMLGFGTGLRGSVSSTQMAYLRDALKVSASLLEAAPEVAQIDTALRFSNGAPMVLWRGTNLTKGGAEAIEASPISSFTHRIDSPEEIGAHAGTFDQAVHFTHRELGPMRQRKEKNYGMFAGEAASFVRRLVPFEVRGATSDAIAHRAVGVFGQFLDSVSDMATGADALLNLADAKGVVSDTAIRKAFVDGGFLDDVRSIADEEFTKAHIAPADKSRYLDEFISDFERRVLDGITTTDILGGKTKRAGQLVPFVPVVKKPIMFKDVGSNDVESILGALPDGAAFEEFTSHPKELEAVVDAYKKERAANRQVNKEKLFQQALLKAGFDAIQYVNYAEGAGVRMSVVVLSPDSVKPLHEVIPQLGKLREALRKRVYDLMAMGVPLMMAIEYVTEVDGDDSGT